MHKERPSKAAMTAAFALGMLYDRKGHPFDTNEEFVAHLDQTFARWERMAGIRFVTEITGTHDLFERGEPVPVFVSDLTGLTLVVSADNLAGGIASAAFIAYLSSLTNVQYSATQYALFSSMMLLAPKWLAGFSGQFVDAYGYVPFFVGTACLGLPVLLLVALAARVRLR